MSKEDTSPAPFIGKVPSPVSSSAGDGQPERPQRVIRTESSLDSVTTIVKDKATDWKAFLDENHGKEGDTAKALIKALLAICPDA